MKFPRRLAARLPARVGLLAAAAALLYLAGAVGMSYVAGFHAVGRQLAHPHLPWLVVSAAAVVLGFVGYYAAYRGAVRAEGGPDELDTRSWLAVVATGF